MADALTSILHTPSSQPQHLLVLLHGWGANAQDVAGLAEVLQLPNWAMAFPNAPFASPYSPGGYMWYSFPEGSLDNLLGLDQPDLQESRERLRTWLTHLTERLEVPLERTVLGGFSQGGAMSLDLGPQLPIAGIMSLSGYLHRAIAPADKAVPTLLVHGTQDTVVPLRAAWQAREQLTAIDTPLDYHEFSMGHEISPAVLNLIQSFTEHRGAKREESE
ncbi:MAG: alpha/beta hydrolase [Cyanobacteria bacterium P01_A01_bin.135]